MRKIFAEIDSDNSGFIDVKELKSLSAKLGGKAMDDSEVEEVMKDLDMNKDHKISFDEFKTWWLSGKQGLSLWMRRLLGYKLSTVKFLDSMSENIKSVVEESKADSTGDDLITNSVRLNLNKFDEAGMMLNARLTFLSPQLKEELNRIRGVHSFGSQDNVLFEFKAAVKDISADEAVKQVEKLLSTLPASMKGWFHVCNDGGLVSLGINSPIARLTGVEAVDPLLDIVTGEIKVDQCVDFNVRFATSPEEILESGEPLIMCLLKGFAIDAKVHLWKKLSDIVMKVLETGELPQDILPFIGGLSPLLLLKMNAHLDLEIDEKMKESI